MEFKISIKKVRFLDILEKILIIYVFFNPMLKYHLSVPPFYRDLFFWILFCFFIFFSFIWGRCPRCKSKKIISLVIGNNLFKIPGRCVIICPNCNTKIEVR